MNKLKIGLWITAVICFVLAPLRISFFGLPPLLWEALGFFFIFTLIGTGEAPLSGSILLIAGIVLIAGFFDPILFGGKHSLPMAEVRSLYWKSNIFVGAFALVGFTLGRAIKRLLYG